jgi:hypothetical protein
VVEDHDGALWPGEAGERPVDDVLVRYQVERADARRPDVDGRGRELTPTLGRADLRIARVHDEPMRPCLEPAGIAELAQVAPDADERPLRRIVGEVMVSQDGHGHATEAPGRLADERRERGVVTLLSPEHEFRVHGSPLGRGPQRRRRDCIKTKNPAQQTTI